MCFLAVLLIVNITPTYINSDKHLEVGIIFAAVIYSLVTIIYKLFLPQLFPTDFTDNIFVQNWGHSYIADFLILSVPLLIHKMSPKKVPTTMIFLIPITLAIILSNSRSSLFALIVGIVLFKTSHIYHRVFKLLMVIMLFASLVYVFLFSNYLKSPNGSRPEYWTQAITGFTSSPLVGVGPGNFGIINRQYRQSSSNSTNYAHNSILESLSGNGILFTILAFGLIGYGLYYQYHHNHLFFVLGTISFVNSLLDPSWSSPGVLTLTLIIIFWKIKSKTSHKYLIAILAAIILTYFFSKTTSDIFYAQEKYELSLKFDPFNPNSLTKLVDTKQTQIMKLYRQDPNFLNVLADPKFLPQNESIVYESIRLDPKGSANQISRLVNFYTITNDYQKLQKIIPLVYSSIDPVDTPFNLCLEISKSIYKLGLYEWQQKNYKDAIAHFEKAVIYSRKWSHFELELATALWHSGQTENAYLSLANCQKNTASVKHCYDFEVEVSKKGWPQVGSHATSILSLHVPADNGSVDEGENK